MTASEAERRIQDFLDTLHETVVFPPAPKMKVLSDLTDERDWGWIIYYQSEEYLETQDPSDMLAGNAPYFVNRSTGEMIHTGTAYPIEHYVQEYEAQLQSDD
jgi:hypothetical protein